MGSLLVARRNQCQLIYVVCMTGCCTACPLGWCVCMWVLVNGLYVSSSSVSYVRSGTKGSRAGNPGHPLTRARTERTSAPVLTYVSFFLSLFRLVFDNTHPSSCSTGQNDIRVPVTFLLSLTASLLPFSFPLQYYGSRLALLNNTHRHKAFTTWQPYTHLSVSF